MARKGEMGRVTGEGGECTGDRKKERGMGRVNGRFHAVYIYKYVRERERES